MRRRGRVRGRLAGHAAACRSHARRVSLGLAVGESIEVLARIDGSAGRVELHADLVHLGRPPQRDVPMILQVSRWDPLKDMLGVMLGFAKMVEAAPDLEAAFQEDVAEVGDSLGDPALLELSDQYLRDHSDLLAVGADDPDR